MFREMNSGLMIRIIICRGGVPDLSRLKSNKFVCYVGVNNFIIKIISSLLLLQGGTREVSILPLSPLRIPPIPLKRLLKRRRGYACLRQALIADRVEDETMLCVQQSMISNPAREARLLPGGEAVTEGD